MSPQTARALYTLINVIAWASLFSVYPPDSTSWYLAFFYINAVLTSIFIWALFDVLSTVLVLLMSRTLNATLADKALNAHRKHVALFALLGARPDAIDERRLRVTGTDDPRVMESVVRAVEDVDFVGRLRVDPVGFVGRSFALRTPAQARYLGLHLFSAMARRSAPQMPDISLEDVAVELGLSDKDAGALAGVPDLQGTLREADFEARLALTRASYPENSIFASVDAAAALAIFDPYGTGVCSLEQMMDGVVGMIAERANLRATITNSRDIVASLHFIIAACMNVIVLIIDLSFFGMNTTSIWIGASGILLSLSFVFGGSAKNVFDAVVFHFGMHPFDVGDKIKVGADETVYHVERVTLLATHLRRADGQFTRMPNPLLVAAVIYNIRESGNYGCVLAWTVDTSCAPTVAQVQSMERELTKFLRRNPDSYAGTCAVFVSGVDQDKVKLNVSFAFAFSDLDGARTSRERQRVIDFVAGVLDKRGFTAGGKTAGWKVE